MIDVGVEEYSPTNCRLFTRLGAERSSSSDIEVVKGGQDFSGLLKLMEKHPFGQTRARRSRKALTMTDTELKLIAAAAIIGLNSMPEKG